MNDHLKAKRWREKTGKSVAELASLTGYSPESIYLFEKGFTYDARGATKTKKPKIRTRDINERAFHRYRMACAGVNAALGGTTFNW